MENVALEVVLSLVPQIGLGVLFFWIYLRERKTNETMVQTLLAAFEKSTEATVKTTNAIENNTKAVEQLTNRVEQVGNSTQQLSILTEKVNDIWRARNVTKHTTD